MRSSLSILATVLFLAGQARAFNAYVGCLDINSAALDSTIILNSAAVQSPAACAVRTLKPAVEDLAKMSGRMRSKAKRPRLLCLQSERNLL